MEKILKKLIADRGLSVRELARETGIAQSTLNALVQGRAPSKPEHLLSLSRFFGCSVEFLLTGTDQRPPTLEEVFTQDVFEGWVRIKIERAIPGKRKIKIEED